MNKQRMAARWRLCKPPRSHPPIYLTSSAGLAVVDSRRAVVADAGAPLRSGLTQLTLEAERLLRKLGSFTMVFSNAAYSAYDRT
jgi:hypothetical protein